MAAGWTIRAPVAVAQTYFFAATTGHNVPGGNGRYGTFGIPILNDAGFYTFHSELTHTSGGSTDNLGLFRGHALVPSSFTFVARSGQTVPGGNGVLSGFDPSIHLSADGAVGFLGEMTGTMGGIADNRGIFMGDGFSLSTVVRKGDLEPISGKYHIDFLGFAMSRNGSVAYQTDLGSMPGGSVDTSAIFRNTGVYRQIVIKGNEAPDGNGEFSEMSVRGINANNQVGFHGVLTNTALGMMDNEGVFRGNGETITQIARKSQIAADGNGNYATFDDIQLNDAGQMAWNSYLINTLSGISDNQGIFRGSGGTITRIARTGQVAPGGNGQLDFLFQPVLNNQGAVVFTASLRNTAAGTGLDSMGIYRGNGSSLVEIARQGNAAPESLLFGTGRFQGFGNAVMNDAGVVAFSSTLRDTPGGSSDNRGLYLSDGIDTLAVERKGMVRLGSTVSTFSFDEKSLNIHGQIAYRVGLADGRQQVVIYTPLLRWRHESSGNWSDTGRWTLGLTPASPHLVRIDPTASLTVTAPGGTTTVRGLQIGGGDGLATLKLAGGTLNAVGGVSIHATGRLTGDGRIDSWFNNNGTIETPNDGSHHLTFRDTSINFGTIGNGTMTFESGLINNGVIKGSGWTRFTGFQGLENSYYGGKIQVGAGGYRRISGAVSNSGIIEVINGEIEFDGLVTSHFSTGLITSRNGVMRFNSGINNLGGMGFTFGTSDVTGHIANHGSIHLAGGALVTFYDDFLQSGTFKIGAIGASRSTAVVFGEFSGTGGFSGGGDLYALGDLRPGASPASVVFDGNLYFGATTNLHIELGGTDIGLFDQLLISGDLGLSGNLFVETIDGYLLQPYSHFMIASIGGNRFGEFGNLQEGDLVGRFNNVPLYITYTAGNGNDIALFSMAAIPEPGSLVGLSILVVFFVLRRRHQFELGRD